FANCYGCALADYDQDGDADLLLCSDDGVHLLRNDSAAQRWIGVRLSGGMQEAKGPAPDGLAWSNAQCLGARVTVTAGREQFRRELEGSRGVGSGDQPLLYFGLGQRKGPFTVAIRYPSGREW